MGTKTHSSATNLLLLLTAMIWGFAFVAQHIGMKYIGPFFFNGIRFLLGAISLIPLMYYLNSKKKQNIQFTFTENKWQKQYGGLILGVILFVGVSLQQVGLQYTTAGKSGFITGLYVIFVAIFGFLFKHKTTIYLWIAVILATIGMYLLSIADMGALSYGDAITFVSSIVWSFHVLLTAYLSPKMDSLKLSFYQFMVCALLSLIVALFIEDVSLNQIVEAKIPILYGGLLSVGIAYTLQVVVQKHAHPTYSAIILSLESLFAVIGGWLILNETLSLNALIGCGLMLTGMIVAQLKQK